ncbi:PTS sugar transporter subunit IIA [Streptomyces sp. NBC_00006]|uniref:PTS sugar transporter subunit IIA n=1 Tax=unclassified Streptomyces TaxID=2593676 RepID=UPI002250104E|nr:MULTISPECIES: PTS sugar transporter subunit IIA [unclassified Streptomyces]MCX4835070.1 PTS sugar transporter subunit IIA [Streptomyces sp. NBC_01016]MCX5529048.1 PTS sugar transporter subunit IIA [Streptomyces sp. NBC_00006]
MSELSDLIPVEAIRLDVAAPDWQSAVRTAGDLLVSTDVSTDTYTGEMLRNVEENGPYIVIAPGFAFAHARPSPAVRRTGMSWVRLSTPVNFGHETNDPVHLVVALAAADAGAHTQAMGALARLLADPDTSAALDHAPTPEALRQILVGDTTPEPESAAAPAAAPTPSDAAPERPAAKGSAHGMHKILTVCGNGVGTSLFLKSTLDKVLDRWKWGRYITTEATDTISAKGKASEAVAIMTSREIARTLGDVGVPVRVIEDFTSTKEVDAAMRDLYDV